MFFVPHDLVNLFFEGKFIMWETIQIPTARQVLPSLSQMFDGIPTPVGLVLSKCIGKVGCLIREEKQGEGRNKIRVLVGLKMLFLF